MNNGNWMTVVRPVLLITSLVFVIICNSQITRPKNLEEAVLYFQQSWTKTELDQFKDKSERQAVNDIHFETGTWIRNNWVRGNRDSALTSYFHTLGIYNPDDISSIILTSFHRTLNKRDIALDKQVESYKAYWKPINECKEMQKAKSVSNYNKFKVGDSLTMYMHVDTSYGMRNAMVFQCPANTRAFDVNKDLILKGTLTKKYFINDTANMFFVLDINYMNRSDTKILMTTVKMGDKKDFSLTGLTIE
jgi:hypothetical protein